MSQTTNVSQRLISLDVMRGLIMILLAGESARIYESIAHLHPTGVAGSLITQFFHHPWNGLRAWDLVQPAFMTMAGAAMFISYYYKTQKGITWSQNFRHIALRCLKLFIFGTALHCVYAGRLVWELWNVLTQLSVTTLIAYLIIRRSFGFQLAISLLLLLATDLMYRFVLLPGFEEPFIQGHNFGAFMDTVLMGKINPDGWVTINFIPTAAHTIWGALAGKLLISDRPRAQKIKILVIAGLIGLVTGFGLDLAGITPIIKRIATASFTLASGGWVMLVMALLYWIIDVKQNVRYAWIATVVGMNAIFIYLFFETVGAQWVNPTTGIFVKGFTALAGIPESIREILSAFAVLALEWGLCYWLFKKKIFFKL
ncbi:acyltransferase family protein [Chitinophaga sp. ARDCPP14]|uniref:acyltransferase family protein n=1 Tax=Chitinophaga sp. ARDCPP14 TaxID=3391139 RepID=UPI003F5202B3